MPKHGLTNWGGARIRTAMSALQRNDLTGGGEESSTM